MHQMKDEGRNTYTNRALTAACETLLEFDLTVDEVDNLAENLGDEYKAMLEAKAEAAWEDRSAPDDSAYRRQMRDAGRGHLLG